MSLTTEQAMTMRAQIEKAAALIDDDNEAEESKWMFPPFDGNGHHYKPGDRFVYNGRLAKVKDGMEHTSQPDWTPDSAASLYEYIAKPDETGTRDNPIAYDGNMELNEGIYYTQGGVVYLCTRDTGIAVYNALSELIAIYVIAAE